MKDLNHDKGTEAEQYTLEKVNAAFELMGDCEISRKRRVKNNVILPFKSVYSGVTAEIDIIVITPFFIFPIEVKSCHYSSCNYGDQCWKDIKGEGSSNPLLQNQNHKAVLCSELGVPSDKVISIVVLLQDGKQSMTTDLYKNCYVLDGIELEQTLLYLFSTEDTTNLDKDIYERFGKLQSRTNYYELARHTEKVDYVKAIQKYAKKNYFPVFSRYQIAKCEVCNSGYLVIRTNLVKEDPLGSKKIIV